MQKVPRSLRARAGLVGKAGQGQGNITGCKHQGLRAKTQHPGQDRFRLPLKEDLHLSRKPACKVQGLTREAALVQHPGSPSSSGPFLSSPTQVHCLPPLFLFSALHLPHSLRSLNWEALCSPCFVPLLLLQQHRQRHRIDPIPRQSRQCQAAMSTPSTALTLVSTSSLHQTAHRLNHIARAGLSAHSDQPLLPGLKVTALLPGHPPTSCKQFQHQTEKRSRRIEQPETLVCLTGLLQSLLRLCQSNSTLAIFLACMMALLQQHLHQVLLSRHHSSSSR